nr:hypothetical protein [Marinicella sp. W31]MDC2879409.1 hypothetical protein [Marinicella sp. W31]
MRLAIPARHADLLQEGATIEISRPDAEGEATGKLVKLYPELDNNRVIADVEVDGLKTGYVNERFLVRVPIGERHAFSCPQRPFPPAMGWTSSRLR